MSVETTRRLNTHGVLVMETLIISATAVLAKPPPVRPHGERSAAGHRYRNYDQTDIVPCRLAVLPSPTQCVGLAWLSLMVTQVLRAQTDSAVTTGWAWKPASRITAIITNPGASVTAQLLSGPDVRKDPRR
jgi:hypothetical protein